MKARLRGTFEFFAEKTFSVAGYSGNFFDGNIVHIVCGNVIHGRMHGSICLHSFRAFFRNDRARRQLHKLGGNPVQITAKQPIGSSRIGEAFACHMSKQRIQSRNGILCAGACLRRHEHRRFKGTCGKGLIRLAQQHLAELDILHVCFRLTVFELMKHRTAHKDGLPRLYRVCSAIQKHPKAAA